MTHPKLNAEKARLIAKYLKRHTLREAAEHFGISKSTGYFIRSGRSWRSATGIDPKLRAQAVRKDSHYSQGEDHSRARLRNEAVLAIFNSSLPQRALAEKYKTTLGTIGAIRGKKTYVAVTQGEPAPRGPCMHGALRREQVIEIARDQHRTVSEIAERFKIHPSSIYMIKSNQSYCWIDCLRLPARKPRHLRFTYHEVDLISHEMDRFAISRRKCEPTINPKDFAKALGEKWGCSVQTIRRIRRGVYFAKRKPND